MRECAERADDENDIPFAVDDGTFEREINGRIRETVDEIPDVRRVERVGFLLGESCEERGLSGRVFADADHDVSPLCIRHGDAVPDEFRASCAREQFPVLRGLVIEFIGFDASADDGFPVCMISFHDIS